MTEQDNLISKRVVPLLHSLLPASPDEPKTVSTAKQPAPAPQSHSESYLANICAKHKVRVPAFSVMFADQLSKPHVMVPLSKLAVFCDRSAFDVPPGKKGKALGDVTKYFAGENFLNLDAEIKPKQVEKVLLDILEFGSLLQGIKVCEVTGVPEPNNYDPTIFQVWDGRHRVVALSIMYGESLEVPVDVSVMEHGKALQACVRSNDTRPIGKREKVKYLGLKDGGDAKAAYAKRDGKHLPIAQWIAAHALKMVPDPIIQPFEGILVADTLTGKKGITIVNFVNTIKGAIGVLGSHVNFYSLDKKTVAIFNVITATIERTWVAIDSRSSGSKASTAWNAYSSIVMGHLIGRAIDYWGSNQIKPTEEVIQGFADQLSQVATSYMDSSAELYARTPAGQLEAAMISFAEARLGISLPRMESSIFVDANLPS